MIEAALAIALFTGIVSCLVLLILAARRQLVPAGSVCIRVNARRTVSGARGQRLLDALAAAAIPLPGACGGKGTCGQCRITVEGEPPPVLPTEASKLSRQEIASGERLACQLTLRRDLEIRIPDEIFGVRRLACRVRSSRCVGTLIKEIVADLPEDEQLRFRAGSFVQVTAPPFHARFRDFPLDPEVRDEWDRLDLWRYEVSSAEPATRAYSLANHPGEDRVIMLVIRLATPPPGAPESAPPGVVSSYLFNLEVGASLDVAGPYGHFFASEGEREMVFVGGGVGMAPLRSHIFDQLLRLRARRPISFWYGARNLRELFYAGEFERLQSLHSNFRWVVALSEPRAEDAWTGEVGFVHEVLHRRYLADHPDPGECEYYLCGPPLMIRATRALLERLGVPGENVRFDDFGS